MKILKCGIVTALLFAIFSQKTSSQYKIQPVPIQTRWAALVGPENALKEYPRPQMVRAEWVNLNGLWDYAITGKDAGIPVAFEGKILVPYPIESALSGVKKALLPSQSLWYRHNFSKPAMKAGEQLKLNFGAVDYECQVYVNGGLAGTHKGGYTAFSFDITAKLKAGNNELVVKVNDPTGEGIGPHGKQVLDPEPNSIYYTASSGIWQTVWMEVVPDAYIKGIRLTPDVDKGLLNVVIEGKGKPEIFVYDPVSKKEVSRSFATFSMTDDGSEGTVKIPNAKLWSPAHPFLYDLTVKMGTDEVKSYFGMRKVSIAKDQKGSERIMLNNKPYFNLGTLDQGFWPEGLYTAATDEALAFDIQAIKAMGFNTIRKHIKVEPARWYYHADKLGMLVWQDMVNPNQGLPEGAKEAFEAQSAEILSQLHNYPSITTWVLFNEKWGAYDQERLTKWIKTTDPSRIVNGHSGEILYVNEKLRSPSPNAYVAADMTDVHSYPDPMNSEKLPGKARVCGEFGGIGVFIPDHQWNVGAAWGYINEKPTGLKAKYSIMNQHMEMLEEEGLGGSVYTQPFDVEGEQNGLMTYDREVIKIPFAELRKIHARLNPDLKPEGAIQEISRRFASLERSTKNADLTEPIQVYNDMITGYLRGNRDSEFLRSLTTRALQNKDAAGRIRFGTAYLEHSKPPYTSAQLDFIASITTKVTDKGFEILAGRLPGLTDKEQRKLQQKLMNIIYADVIAPYVSDEQVKPDWAVIEAAVKPYGSAGEEIFLRAKTIHTFNQKDWVQYKPAAKVYLEKYGAHIPANEKEMFGKAVEEN